MVFCTHKYTVCAVIIYFKLKKYDSTIKTRKKQLIKNYILNFPKITLQRFNVDKFTSLSIRQKNSSKKYFIFIYFCMKKGMVFDCDIC